jgi:hypothetical protein
MDNSDQRMNKLRESFENYSNSEEVPEFLWDNLKEELDEISADRNEVNNKIKSSFESITPDKDAGDLWPDVENRLEIETVWKKVRKKLNRRTRLRYWQEKSMQLGIAALAIFWVRGCGVPEPFNTSHYAHTISQNEESVVNEDDKVIVTDNVDESNDNEQYLLTGTEKKTPDTDNLSGKSEEEINNKKSSKDIVENNKSTANNKQNSTIVSSETAEHFSSAGESDKSKVVLNETSIKQKYEKEEPFNSLNSDVVISKSTDRTNSQEVRNGNHSENHIFNTLSPYSWNSYQNNDVEIAQSPLKFITLSANPGAFKIAKSDDIYLSETTETKKFFKSTALATLRWSSDGHEDSSIYEIQNFHVENVLSPKTTKIRFELGISGKLGTSLLLGDATYKAMETTSMLKTKVRPSGGIGIMFNCFVSRNDAFVLGLYPYISTQQYFGGYSREGRFYQKEIKLDYFDFTIGYQRTLFHYNEFRGAPSSVYARLDYGFGYLSKGEEIINSNVTAVVDMYRKINHRMGLSIGNRHQINRIVLDYGISCSVGVCSVMNGYSVVPSSGQSNLMRVGGYLGLNVMI